MQCRGGFCLDRKALQTQLLSAVQCKSGAIKALRNLCMSDLNHAEVSLHLTERETERWYILALRCQIIAAEVKEVIELLCKGLTSDSCGDNLNVGA